MYEIDTYFLNRQVIKLCYTSLHECLHNESPKSLFNGRGFTLLNLTILTDIIIRYYKKINDYKSK